MRRFLVALAVSAGVIIPAFGTAEARATSCSTRQTSTRTAQTWCNGSGWFALLGECSRTGYTYYTQDYAVAPGLAAIACRSGYRITWLEVVKG
jgi:hypothetical protein